MNNLENNVVDKSTVNRIIKRIIKIEQEAVVSNELSSNEIIKEISKIIKEEVKWF